jgi:hypothetical protein
MEPYNPRRSRVGESPDRLTHKNVMPQLIKYFNNLYINL